jgi:hypothetical protein
MDFVIVCTQRTGSTLLTQLFDSQNGVLCNGAIFEARPGRMPVRWAKEPGLIDELVNLRAKDPDSFLTRVLAERLGCRSVGFKICPGHNDPILDKLLANPAMGKIVLVRQNALAVYSSAMIARKSGERRYTVAGAAPETRPPVEFNARRFMRFWERYAGYYRSVFECLNASNQTFQLIHYSEINDPCYFGRLLTYIGAEPGQENVEVKNKKQNSSDILSRFSNPGEVETFLKEHRLLGWCYETDTTLDPSMAG